MDERQEGDGGCRPRSRDGGHRWHGELIEKLMALSLRKDDPRNNTKVPIEFPTVESYINKLLHNVVKNTRTILQTELHFCDETKVYNHNINTMVEICHPQYLLDIKHRAMCHDVKICPTVQRGDLIILSAAKLPVSFTNDRIFALVVEDEEETYRSAFKVHIVNKKKDEIGYKYAAHSGINLARCIDCWLSGHAKENRSQQGIINTIIHYPKQVTDRCLRSNLFEVPNSLGDSPKRKMEAITSIASSLLCTKTCDHHHVEIIKGPQGAGKTTLLTLLLVTLSRELKIVVYALSSSEIVEILNLIPDLGLPSTVVKHFYDNVLIFGKKTDLESFGSMSLKSHNDTAIKYLSSPGWKYFIIMAIQVTEYYKPFYEVFAKRRLGKTFLDIFKEEVIHAFNQLQGCISYFQSTIPGFNADIEETKGIIKLMKEIEEDLGQPDLDDHFMRKAFDVETDLCCDLLDTKYAVAEALNNKRLICVDMLKKLKARFEALCAPSFKTRDEVKDCCIRNANVIFCSVDECSDLNDLHNHNIDCLFIDNVDLFNETDTLVPLSIPSLRSIVLAGDLSEHAPTRQACQQDKVNASLLKRLSNLGFNKHLLHGGYKYKSPPMQPGKIAPDKSKVLQIEFSWIERPHNAKYILPPVRHQKSEATCVLHSIMATTESLYKYNYASKQPPQDYTIILDIEDMKTQYRNQTGYEYGKEPAGHRGWSRVESTLKSLQNYGVIGYDEFASDEKVIKSLPVKISSFRTIESLEEAYGHLRRGGILVGSMKMSYNFWELSPGEVYHYDANRPIINPESKTAWSHAVMLIGYGQTQKMEVAKDATDLTGSSSANKMLEDAGYLVYQNSYGVFFGFGGGYGRVGVASVKKIAVVTI